jgi:hypothetical protein
VLLVARAAAALTTIGNLMPEMLSHVFSKRLGGMDADYQRHNVLEVADTWSAAAGV